MKYAVAMAGLILAAPVLAAIPYPPAGSAAGQAGGLLSRLPPLPQTYDQAAGQWVLDDGKRVAGPALAAAEDAIKRAMTNLPNMQGNALMQHYMTPEGQAELKNMSQAQQMAIAQQMAASAMA